MGLPTGQLTSSVVRSNGSRIGRRRWNRVNIIEAHKTRSIETVADRDLLSDQDQILRPAQEDRSFLLCRWDGGGRSIYSINRNWLLSFLCMAMLHFVRVL